MNFDQLRILYKLKEVYRANSVADRKESSAEHSWSCLVLADYFLSKHNFSVDRLKVYELLMYHDAVEIIVGDVSIDDDEARVNKVQQEKDAIGVLKRKLPVELSEKFASLSAEYQENSTREARFAHAINGLDAQIHELDYKKDWQGWDEAKFRRYIEPKLIDFPELKVFFEELVAFVTTEGYFT